MPSLKEIRGRVILCIVVAIAIIGGLISGEWDAIAFIPVLAIYFYFRIYRPYLRIQESQVVKQGGDSQYNIAKIKPQQKPEENIYLTELTNSELMVRCTKILNVFSEVSKSERFGKIVRVEVQCMGEYDWLRLLRVGAIKLIVERYGNDIGIDGLIEGYIPNPEATADNYEPKYITLNHREMYSYIYGNGFPEGLGGDIELFPSDDSDYAEWVVYLHNEIEVLYDKHTSYRDGLFGDELAKQYKMHLNFKKFNMFINDLQRQYSNLYLLPNLI